METLRVNHRFQESGSCVFCPLLRCLGERGHCAFAAKGRQRFGPVPSGSGAPCRQPRMIQNPMGVAACHRRSMHGRRKRIPGHFHVSGNSLLLMGFFQPCHRNTRGAGSGPRLSFADPRPGERSPGFLGSAEQAPKARCVPHGPLRGGDLRANVHP